ncbi:hypothetical protein PAECIP111891_05584 [Paenibacillus allorhizoplanae]|uniref:P/Homo B domain-containing protein n=1 Tax=Paenibacillus allorhizoplanae TaxID=2905648 RepID=A0ABN8H0V2_9BACL|nr:hypothetical protein [Paenibacillus allorhizoplanae]CAH1223922.1 hypothetical protein PAECIP111891_05584 [Paenibacillus allorhizoplanae]
MKKLSSILLVLVSILSLTACSTDSTQTANPTSLQTPIISTVSPSASATPVATAIPTTAPTAVPTEAPTSTATPTIATSTPAVKSITSSIPVATQKPVQTQTVEKITKEEKPSIQIISVSSPAPRNSTATLKAKVAPGATASIVVHYKSGPSTAAGLESKKADSNGNVSWSWRVGGNTTLGSWRITVSSDGSSEDTTFEVVH